MSMIASRSVHAALPAILVMALAACADDRESCLTEAAKMPTETGVRVAVAQCNRKHPAPIRSGAASPSGPWSDYSPNNRPVQSPLDQFDPTTARPAQPGMFDDLIPARRRPDVVQELLPITSLVMVLLLTVLGVVPWPMNIGLWLIRIGRMICLTTIAIMGVRLYMGSAAFPGLLWASIAANTGLFFVLWALVHWLHRRRHGTDHPKLASPWAV